MGRLNHDVVKTRISARTNRRFIFQLEFRDKNKMVRSRNTKASCKIPKSSSIRLMQVLMFSCFQNSMNPFLFQ
jgi:hypothetical protein